MHYPEVRFGIVGCVISSSTNFQLTVACDSFQIPSLWSRKSFARESLEANREDGCVSGVVGGSRSASLSVFSCAWGHTWSSVFCEHDTICAALLNATSTVLCSNWCCMKTLPCVVCINLKLDFSLKLLDRLWWNLIPWVYTKFCQKHICYILLNNNPYCILRSRYCLSKITKMANHRQNWNTTCSEEHIVVYNFYCNILSYYTHWTKYFQNQCNVMLVMW